MKKKVIIGVVSVFIVLCVVLGINALTDSTSSKGEKSIEVIVIDVEDNNKQLLSKKVDTDAENLTQVLKEEEAFKATIESGTYGSYLVSLAGKDQDQDNGPWWVFESDNNKVCVDAGMCPAMDEVLIQDGDTFTFKLIATFE